MGVIKSDTYTAVVNRGHLAKLEMSWMNSLFSDPLIFEENINISVDGSILQNFHQGKNHYELTWKNNGIMIRRKVYPHKIWPCLVIEFEIETGKPFQDEIIIDWEFQFNTHYVCIYNKCIDNENSYQVINDLIFPIFFHKIHKPKDQKCILQFKILPGKQHILRIKCPIWCVKNKFDSQFSGFAFLVKEDDLIGAASALSSRTDYDYDDRLIQVLSRKFSPIFWWTKTVDEEIFDFISEAPIRVVIATTVLNEPDRERLKQNGITLIEMDVSNRFELPISIQKKIDHLLKIERVNQIAVICPTEPVFFINNALTAALHGYQFLLYHDDIDLTLQTLQPSSVFIVEDKNNPLPKRIMKRIHRVSPEVNVLQRDELSLCEGTTMSQVTYGGSAGIYLDKILNPEDKRYDEFQEKRKKHSPDITPEKEFQWIKPSLNAPPLLIVSTYSRGNFLPAISAAAYTKARNAVLFLLPDFNPGIKSKIKQLLSELKRFLTDESFGLWQNIYKNLCLKTLIAGSALTFDYGFAMSSTWGPKGYISLSVNKAENWLKEHFPITLTGLKEGKFSLPQVEKQLEELNDEYIKRFPQALRKDYPLDKYNPFYSVTDFIIVGIGQLLLENFPPRLLKGFNYISKKSILFFPADPYLPLELMLLPFSENTVHTLHSAYPFGRIVCNKMNDASLHSSYIVLRSYKCAKDIKGIIIADPQENLPASKDEGKIISKTRYMPFDSLIGKKARIIPVSKRIKDYNLIFFSGHGGETSDGRTFFVMNDGRFYSEDIPPLEKNPIVIANACHSASYLGFDSLGTLAISFIKNGAASYVGSLWPILSNEALMISAHILDGGMEDSIGSALKMGREPGVIGSFTKLAYVLFGDPNVALIEPLTFGTEARFYKHEGTFLLRAGQHEASLPYLERAANLFKIMYEEFLERAGRNVNISEVWEDAANAALGYSLGCQSDIYISQANIADDDETKRSYQASALEALEKGKQLFPNNSYFQSRSNALKGELSTIEGYQLLISRNYQSASLSFEKAMTFYMDSLKSEKDEQILALVNLRLYEAKGLGAYCRGMIMHADPEKSYRNHLESLNAFRSGSMQLGIGPELVAKLFELQTLPLEHLLNMDSAHLEALEKSYKEGQVPEGTYHNLKEKLESNLKMFEELMNLVKQLSSKSQDSL